MATVRPFRGIGPGKELAEKVVALPYDVMSRKEAAEMAKGNPFSFLHISRSEIDLPRIKDQYSTIVYQKAKENLERFLKEGILVEDSKPMFYIYKQVMGGVEQVGLVGCVSVDDYLNDVIKKHEHTRKEKEKDRIRHFDVCSANTEPVFLTYRDDKNVKILIEGYMKRNQVRYDFVGEMGVRHMLWAITDDDVIAGLSGLFKRIPALYIADGHHRSASACKVGLMRRQSNPNYTGDEEFNYFMAVIFPDNNLRVMDYNRVVKDLHGLKEEELVEKIKEAGFSVECKGASRYKPEKPHSFAMYLGRQWYKLTAGEELVPEDAVAALDVSILQDRVLRPLLGIDDPRTDNRIDFIGGIRGLEELERRVSSDMKVAFAVYPVDICELMTVSDEGRVMPPKSTWFEPKLGSGLFVHRI